MATEFQRSKVAVVFGAMDADHDGYLQESEFAALAERWTTIRGTAPGSPEYARLNSIMLGWWSALLAASDDDGDGRVTLEEVMRLVDRLTETDPAVVATAEAMFEAIDEDGDRRISQEEYRRLIEAWNGCATDTDEVFSLLDLDGDGYVSQEEFTRLWGEFWAGDDPSAQGTWAFGRFELPMARR
jgi:Ca2+-binding EF-hand superfamily protein